MPALCTTPRPVDTAGRTRRLGRSRPLNSQPLNALLPMLPPPHAFPAADPTGELYSALGFSPGFAPDAGISAYAKLLPMLAGIGSPGTVQVPG